MFRSINSASLACVMPRAMRARRMVIAYTRESQRQKALIRKARLCEARLLFIVTAFNQLLASSYIRKLLDNGAVARFLQASHADICSEFEKLAGPESLLKVP